MRLIDPLFKQAYRDHALTWLRGPSHAGKAALAKRLTSLEVIDLRDPQTYLLAENEPQQLLMLHASGGILYAIERCPRLLQQISQTLLEQPSTRARFVLLSTTQHPDLLQLEQQLGQRMQTLTLLPPHLLEQQQVSDHLTQLETLLHEALPSLCQTHQAPLWLRCLCLLAENSGNTLHLSQLAKQLNVAVSTMQRWVRLFESSFTIGLLPAYHLQNKHSSKTPKIYFYDTGLLSYLLGDNASQKQLQHNELICQTAKRFMHTEQHIPLYFFEGKKNHYLDLVIEKDGQGQFIRFEHGEQTNEMHRSAFQQLQLPIEQCKVIYQGKDCEKNGLRYQNSKTFLRVKPRMRVA